MKRMYWRPRRVSRTAILLIAAWSLCGYLLVERFQREVRQPHFAEKLEAARLAEQAFRAIREERLRLRIPIDPEVDPLQSGLIGTLMSPVTTNPGALSAKQSSLNPNFAAIIVHYLMRAGVQPGDTVAVGYSGSFPALNIATLAAIEALRLRAIIISSASSSQWGANEPALLWLDMEKVLLDRKIISRGSVAASLGGIEDRGLGMSQRGIRILRETIERHGLPLIDPPTFQDSIRERMRVYREESGGEPFKVYINVGGGTISVGRRFGKKLFKPGLNKAIPQGAEIESVMSQFLEEGVPVVHLVEVGDLVTRFGLEVQPRTPPSPGQGKIFVQPEYNRWLAFGILISILGSLYLFVRSDLGFRMTRGGGGKPGDKGHPEPMV